MHGSVGHSYIVYGPLLAGLTSVLFEGKPVGTPDAGAFWRVITEHGVEVMFTAPTALRAIKREDPDGKWLHAHDRSQFRTLFLAGERCDPETLAWASDLLDVPVIDHWWQTETGWPICCNPMGIQPQTIKPGSAGPPAPGWSVAVLGPGGQPVAPEAIGNIVVKTPLPPGAFSGLWHDQGRFAAYFERDPGYYETADAGYLDDEGYIFVMARTDDIINTAGHRLSTGGMEEVLASHPDVAECAVVGVADSLKGQVPIGLAVLKADVKHTDEEIVRQLIQLVRERIGPVASFKLAVVVPRLPKTRSGKILRSTIRSIADGEDYRLPATIDDPAILDEITQILARAGLPRAAD